MDTLFSDLRFAGRLLWKDKGFALTALLTLAVCIGANTAIFSVVHSVLLRPLPVPQSERIVVMDNRYPRAGVERGQTGVPDYFDRLRKTSVFSELALYQQRGHTVGTDAGAERMTGLIVTPSFFRLLRVPVHRGRAFTDADGEIGHERKVILSYPLWQRLFHGDDGAIGRDLRIGGLPYTIVGVMPGTLRFANDEVRLWVPAAFTQQEKSDDSRHSNNWTMIARLKDEATIAQARQQIDALNARNLDRFPAFKQVLLDAGFNTRVAFLQDDIVGEIRGVLYLLWGGVLFVLLIGAVNITNLVLVRSNVRMREIATRQALGAGRGRVARQMLTETTLLTVMGGGLGLLLGRWTLDLLSGMGLDALPRGSEIALDRTVVLFVMALSAAVGVLIGAIPILNAARADLNGVLREEGRSGTSGRSARFVRRALVTAQVALAFVLLVGASLLLASFRKVLALDSGLDPHGVLTATVSLPATQYRDDAQARAFMDRAIDRVRGLPGVESAGLTSNVPFGGNYNDSVILAEGYAPTPGESVVSPTNARVGTGYFEAMRIPLVRGRFFNASDQPGAMRAIIVDELLAARFWPGADPIGKRMFLPNNPENVTDPGPNVQWLTVVGVVASVRQRGLLDAQNAVGAYYFPLSQSLARTVTLVLRTTGDPQAVTASLRGAVRDIDPELPVYGVRTMDERVSMTLVGRRTPMLLGLGFGAVALFLSALGIYGVLAYQVAQRTREIGIRMALGSSTREILGLVLREGALMLAFGLAIGLGGALALGRAMQTLLFDVAPTDPIVLTSGAATLALVALIGSALPARRAARINPATALGE